MGIIERAHKLRKTIENLATNLDDEQALDNTELFAVWDSGKDYSVGDRVNYSGVLYKCLQAHISQDTWTPDVAPSLWAKVLIPPSGDIPVWEQPDSTNPYMTGDKVHYPTIDDPVYESLIDNNIWSPDTYPAGWNLVAEEDIEPKPPDDEEESTEEDDTPTIVDDIPVWTQPTATEAYNTGDRVHYPTETDPVYESVIDGNVWSPEAYPAGWKVIE